MKKLFLILGLLALFSLNGSAWTLTHYSRNSYTFEPLTNVHVNVTSNDTGASQDGFSDTTGLNTFTITDEGNYTITAYYPGYNIRTTSFYFNDDATRVSYLSYDTISNIKFNFADMTLLKHEWCFYTEENRLFGCYYENDTMPLATSHNYTAYPKLNMLEQAGFINIAPFLIQISIFLIIGIILIVLVIAFVVGLIYFVMKHMR